MLVSNDYFGLAGAHNKARAVASPTGASGGVLVESQRLRGLALVLPPRQAQLAPAAQGVAMRVSIRVALKAFCDVVCRIA